ncbi:MAG: hypothetical protein Q8R82_17510 [Hyphomonadaceae bacterium]|nr:hypothetical protein [Hyphomonadaceae bacterium]
MRMNADTPHLSDPSAPAMPPRVRTLWSEACDWVAWLVGMFDRDALKTTGISREHGARVSIWLMNIEGAIRRLILAAALVVAPPSPRASRTCAATRVHTVAASPRRPGFCVFRLRGVGETAPRADARTSRSTKPYGHLTFPADPLLCLGDAPARTGRTAHAATPRARNPLDRWVRPSRQDPDWRAPEERGAFSRRDAMPASHSATRPRATPQPQAQGDLPPSLADWRRRHDAWTQPVPAPDLAARLEALSAVIANPAAAIASAARRLHASCATAPTLMRQAFPDADPPRRAAHIATAGHTTDFLKRCHAGLIAPDTS